MSGHVVERLSPFLDGEVEEAERREIELHLAGCAACAAYLADLAAVDAEARELDVVAPPGYFEALPGRVRSRLRGRPPQRLPVWGWAAAAALLIAVLLPRLAYQPSVPQSTPAVRAPAAPPPASLAASAPPSAVVEEVRPSEEARPRAKRDAQGKGQPSVSGGLAAPAPEPQRRLDEARPGGRAREEAKTEAARAPAQNFGYVTPPASAPPPQATTAEAPEERAAAEAGQAEPQKPSALDQYQGAPPAAGAVSKLRRKQAFEDKETADTKEKDALRPSPRSVQEARTLREHARERARRRPEGAEGDEARLQVVEAGARAYELGGDPRDLETLKADAAAYLERRDARHVDRVRERLRSLEDRP